MAEIKEIHSQIISLLNIYFKIELLFFKVQRFQFIYLFLMNFLIQVKSWQTELHIVLPAENYILGFAAYLSKNFLKLDYSIGFSLLDNSTGFSSRLLDFDYFSWFTGFCVKSPGFQQF